MDLVVSAVFLLLVLFLVGRNLPAARWPVVLAGTLAVILLVVAAERYGYWPASWKVR